MPSMTELARETHLVAAQQDKPGCQSEQKCPRLQIRTVKNLLEDRLHPFEIPDHARVPRSSGVGKHGGTQGGLFSE